MVCLLQVLGAFLPALIRWHNDTHGTDLKLSDFFSYRFCDVWGGSNEDATAKVYAFFETPYFLEQLAPIDGAFEVLQSFAGRCVFKVVTSRQHVVREATMAWLDRHFPGIFADALFGNHWAKEAPDPEQKAPSKMTKRDMCAKAGACALIDDNRNYAEECATSLKQVVLFGSYGWNEMTNGGPVNIVRADSWAAVAPILEKLLADQH